MADRFDGMASGDVIGYVRKTEDEPFRFVIQVNSTAGMDFGFYESDLGTSVIDWGDGHLSQTEPVDALTEYHHQYAAAGEYLVSVRGDAKKIAFGKSRWDAPFYRNLIDILSPLPRTVSRFRKMFYNQAALRSIPGNLFEKCAIGSGESANSIFANCQSLQSIPGGLFDRFSTVSDFSAVFMLCTSIAYVPYGLFKNCISAASFEQAFQSCSALQSCGTDAFDGISPENMMYCFSMCTALTHAPELWEMMPEANGRQCFVRCTAADNYAQIPAGWK